MFPLTKLLLFSHLFIISASICASKNIDNGSESDLRVFWYKRDLSYLSYSNESSFADSKILWMNEKNMIKLEYYPEEKTFFWTTNKGELYSTIWAEGEDMTLEEFNKIDKDILEEEENANLLYSEEDWYPRSIALDEIRKKLYIADATERSIDVFDLDGRNKARIFAGDYLVPMEIAVDPDVGLLFLFAFNYPAKKAQVHRMNMDGTDNRLLVSNLTVEFLRDEARAFAVDKLNKQLYYQENSRAIRMVDYNGHGGVPIITQDRIAHVEIHRNRIYWARRFLKYDFIKLEVHQNFELALDEEDWKFEYTIYSCDISDKPLVNSSDLCGPEKVNDSLRNTYFLSNRTNFPDLFKIVDPSPKKIIADPSLEGNGGCEDHCLLKSSGADAKLSFGCACRVGRKLNDDRKTCSKIVS